MDNLGNDNGGFSNGVLTDCLNKADARVVNVYATEEYMAYARRMRSWAEKGYFPPDAALNAKSSISQVASGRYLGQFNNTDESALSQQIGRAHV